MDSTGGATESWKDDGISSPADHGRTWHGRGQEATGWGAVTGWTIGVSRTSSPRVVPGA